MRTVSRPGNQHHATAQRRLGRYASVQWARRYSVRRAAKSCMLDRKVPGEPRRVTVAASKSRVVVRGVKRCASTWACECCAPAIAERRAKEADQAFAEWMRQGGSLYFVTATLAHTSADKLHELLEVVQWSWSRTWRHEAPRYSSRAGFESVLMNAQRLRPSWYAGMLRTVEITHTDRGGFHPHVHAVIFVEAGADPAEVEDRLREYYGERWADSVGKKGRKSRITPVRDRLTGELVTPGWDVRRVETAAETAEYLTKVEGGWGAGLELTRSDLKRGAKGRQPFDLLHLAMDDDDPNQPRWLALWNIYEKATQGRQRVVASPGLMARCKVEVLEDDEAVEGTLDGEPVEVEASIIGYMWRRLWRSGQAGELVNAVEAIARGAPVGSVWRWPPGWLRTGAAVPR